VDRQAFIDLVVPGAQEVQRRTGMFASVTIAQAIWETGGGVHTPKDINTGEESYNLFGRKAAKGEPYVMASTWEVENGQKVYIKAPFKKFASYTDSVLDRSDFLQLPWYQKACHASNPFDAARFLIETDYYDHAGNLLSYATDPNYVKGIIGVIQGSNLTQYDLPKGEDDEMNKVLEYDAWAWDELDRWAGDAYNDDYLEKWDWVQKIRDKQLTYGELLLLKVLIDERRRTNNKVIREAN
jgi:flagellum-specific peptidoglycan hydrolase FlgJ